MKPLHLFDAMGVELEYMIVDRRSLDVKPLTDQVLKAATGSFYPQYEKPGISWSNELVLHVIELKTTDPVADLAGVVAPFHEDISRINAILAEQGAMLMPGGAHPWMEPDKEMVLWPHRYNAIYAAYNEIFDCRGHGWANLQSCHLNLPFQGDEEFGRLHAAIRLILPLLPALAASTPVVDSRLQSSLDFRMETYKTNSARIPSITGAVVPEPVFTRAEYEEKIFQRMYQDIAPYDPEGILQDEWLNARGAIARFDRDAIEIRIIDVQECPLADLAIAALIVETLKQLVNEAWASASAQKKWQTERLAPILDATIKDAEEAAITDPEYLQLFGLAAGSATAGALWQHLYSQHRKAGTIPAIFQPPLEIILKEGCLARRMVRFLGGITTRDRLTALCRRLSQCLASNTLLTGSG